MTRQSDATGKPSGDEASPGGKIWELAWPQLLMMFFHFWIGFFDVYVAGRIGEDVQAALGMITQTLLFFLIVAMALSNGAVSTISQSLGAGRTLRAKRYIGLCLMLVLAAGLILLVAGIFLRGQLLALLQVPVRIEDITTKYLLIYLLVTPVYYLFIVSNAVFRAQKQVHIPLLSMVLVTGLNTWADFGLCFGGYGLPRIGYMGLAWATLISVCGGCLFNTFVLGMRGWLRLAHFPPIRWIKRALPYLWRVAWPAGLMQVLWHTGYLVLFAITASLPREEVVALAAFAAGIRMESLLFLPAVAFNMTASILVGHYLGSKDFSGARSIGLRTWAFGCLLISLLGALLWLFVPELAQLLSDRAPVQAEIESYLRFNILAIPFTGTTMILGGVFIGAGATRFNMFAIGGTVWLVRLPLAYILGHLVLVSATGIWAAMLISQMVQATLMFLLFWYKDWYRFSMQSRKIQSQAAGA